MGYSGRYHAASLAAVFIALAIGILIGIGLADDVVSTASQELENSLRGERDSARDRVASLEADVASVQKFSEQALPALISGRLTRQRVAVIELGDVPDSGLDDTAEAAISAVRGAGGTLASVGSIPLPPDPDPLIETLGPRFAGAKRDPEALRKLGAAAARGLLGGGARSEALKQDLYRAFNGSLDGVSRVVLIRNPRDDADGEPRTTAGPFEAGFLAGIERSSAGAVGVEQTLTDPSTLAPFSEAGIATVDNVGDPAGEVSVVHALNGAVGDFGTKDGASSLLPDLLSERRGPSG